MHVPTVLYVVVPICTFFLFLYCFIFFLKNFNLVLQESTELLNRHPRPVAVTSLSFPINDVNKFVVGSEEGLVHQGQRHGK